jgi:hypothetical protein
MTGFLPKLWELARSYRVRLFRGVAATLEKFGLTI